MLKMQKNKKKLIRNVIKYLTWVKMSTIFTLCAFTFLNKNKFCQSVCLLKDFARFNNLVS